MSNPIKPRPLNVIAQELAKAGFSKASQRLFIDTFTRIEKVLTDLGQVQSQSSITGRTEQIGVTVSGLASTGDINSATKVVGRTEGIGTTITHLDSTGKLTSTDAIAADGTGSPLTGGKRGFVALNSSNRLADSFKNNALNLSYCPTAATVLSNAGNGATSITIAANSNQYGAGSVAYNSGSVDPGVVPATSFVYADDPGFSGGAVTYAFTSSVYNQTAADGRVAFGSIATSAAPGVTTGGGYTGGTSGKGGGKGYFQQ